MSIDTIVYEKKNASFSLALLEDGGLKELAFGNENSAAEGNVYLGKITRKIELAHDKVGFFVDIDDGRDAFLNAEEFGLKEVNYTEGQSIVVQVAQEKRAEKRSPGRPCHSVCRRLYRLLSVPFDGRSFSPH